MASNTSAVRCVLALLLACGLSTGASIGASGDASARDAALQSACFPPGTLNALAGEKPPIKGLHDFDKQPADAAALAPFTPIAADKRGAIRRVDLPAGEKLIAITFDLCEQRGEIAGYDGDLFDFLRREGVKATLFAGGKWLRSHAARAEQLVSDPLFEIANHGEYHRNLRLLDQPGIAAEISGPQRAYEAARRRLTATQCAASVPDAAAQIPPRMSLFRFPFGACHPASLAAVNDAGLLAIQWDISAGDPDPHQSAQAIARTIVSRIKPGSIIVAHGNGRGFNTAAALPLIVPKLRAMGYSFVTVSELLARGKPVIADSCYDSKPGDTNRYDFLAGGKPKPAAGGFVPTASLPWATDSAAIKRPAPVSKPKAEQPGQWPF